jgi:O-antigen/teichoic acid export membrane protein
MGTTRTQPFLRHALVYGLGNMLLQAAGMLLLPLYTRFLSPAEYGNLEVVIRIGETIAVCLLFNGLRQVLLMLHGQSESEAERRSLARTAVAVVAGFVAVGGLLAFTVSELLASLLRVEDSGLLRLGVLTAMADSAFAVLMTLVQARTQSVFFVTVTFTQFLGRLVLCLLLVAGMGWGARGVLIASLVSSSLCAAALAIRELCGGSARMDMAGARKMLGFALPFLVCGLGFTVLNYGDRLFLLPWAGEHEVGLYAFGYKLALVVTVFARGPLLMVWGPSMYQLARGADAPEVFGRAFTRIQAAYVFVGLGLCLLLDEAIAVLGGAAYAEAAAVVPVVVLAYFFLGTADLRDGAFYLRQRGDLKGWVALASSALMLALYALLIPPWGAAGAAWATLLGLAGHAALTRWVSQRVFAIRNEAGRVAAMLALAAALWVVSRLLPATAWAIPAKIGLWALWPLTLWKTGLVRPDEKAWAQAAVTQALTLFRGKASRGARMAAETTPPTLAGYRKNNRLLSPLVRAEGEPESGDDCLPLPLVGERSK